MTSRCRSTNVRTERQMSCQVEPFFALPWIITWFAHQLTRFDEVARLYDVFLVSHPLFSLYVSAAVVLEARARVLQCDCDFGTMHGLLSKLPLTMELEKVVARAVTLIHQVPPAELLLLSDAKDSLACVPHCPNGAISACALTRVLSWHRTGALGISSSHSSSRRGQASHRPSCRTFPLFLHGASGMLGDIAFGTEESLLSLLEAHMFVFEPLAHVCCSAAATADGRWKAAILSSKVECAGLSEVDSTGAASISSSRPSCCVLYSPRSSSLLPALVCSL
jgi:hypothetical protein